jgi:Icc-related predicted phosphoesterase
MTKLCIIADTHRRHREITIPPCDILIHCGDMCTFGGDPGTLDDIDNWFAEVPAKHVICIGGNHDFQLHHRAFRFAHATYLVDRVVVVEDLTIYGAPWCPELAGFAFYLPDEDLAEKWRAIPSGVDVLVTHTPPHGILDVPWGGTVHIGCKHLLGELGRIKPRVHAFGHVHASHGHVRKDGVDFFNAAVVGGPDFLVCHGPTLHSIEGG